MLDVRMEDLVRQALRDDASTLPRTITVDVLERRLADRRRARGDNRRWVAVAAAAVLAVAGTAGIIAWSRDETTVATTPAPSVVATPSTSTLPPPSALLSDYPEAVLVLEASGGPADGPAGPLPSASSSPVEAGTVTFGGPFVIAIACLGGGEMVAEMRTPSLGDAVYTSAIVECDGEPEYSEYAAPPIDPESPGDTVTVVIPPGRSWRLAVGELPTSLIEPPALAPIALTDGWNLLSDVPAVQLTGESPRTGARSAVPEGVGRLGIFVQCVGPGTVSLSVASAPLEDVACDAAGETHRREAPVAGGEVVSIEAVADQPGAWVRMVVEADGPITTAYPSPPPLPEAVANAPYAAPDPNVVGFGTLGGSRQHILQLGNAQPGQPSGDLLPVTERNPETGTSLHLVSVSSGEVLRTLVTEAAPTSIIDSWADEPNGRIYYAIAREAGVEFRSVAVDGSDDRLLATVARDGLTGFTADLARDGSAFVVDACHAGAGCRRTTVDPASDGDGRTVDRPSGALCRILGIVDGTIIGTTRATCTEPSATSLVAIPPKGETRVLLEDASDEATDGIVVTTDDGARVMYVGSVADDGSSVTIAVLDVETGTVTDLPAGDVGDPRLWPHAAALPDGWVLLAGGSMGDFPWQQAFDRPVPVVVNLVTGERIELPNLPHWDGHFAP